LVFEGGGAELVVALYGDAAQDILCMDYSILCAGTTVLANRNLGALTLVCLLSLVRARHTCATSRPADDDDLLVKAVRVSLIAKR
jgi:hypothetical protein